MLQKKRQVNWKAEQEQVNEAQRGKEPARALVSWRMMSSDLTYCVSLESPEKREKEEQKRACQVG